MRAMNIEPDQTWELDRMRPEDAEGITRLFRDVYGDDYPIRTFIDPELLMEENRAARLISSVARTPKGDIVGHNAIFHSAPSEKIFESGAGLVHKDYRGGKGIFTALMVHGQKIAQDEFQAAAIWGEPVTNHRFAQKATHSVGWRTFAVEVDLMPAAAFAKEASATGRVSTLMDFFELHPRPHQIFTPPIYEDQLRSLYLKLATPRELGVSQGRPGAGVPSRIETQIFSFARMSRLAVWQIGADFEDTFNTAQQGALDQGVDVLQVWLRLTDPGVGWAVERLRSMAYFFGGLLPYWFDDDGMLMQRTTSRPHWEHMQIAFERGQQVVDMARRDWEAIQTGA